MKSMTKNGLSLRKHLKDFWLRKIKSSKICMIKWKSKRRKNLKKLLTKIKSNLNKKLRQNWRRYMLKKMLRFKSNSKKSLIKNSNKCRKKLMTNSKMRSKNFKKKIRKSFCKKNNNWLCNQIKLLKNRKRHLNLKLSMNLLKKI